MSIQYFLMAALMIQYGATKENFCVNRYKVDDAKSWNPLIS